MTVDFDSMRKSYASVGTYLCQLLKNETIEVDDVILMPLNLTSQTQSVILKDSINLKSILFKT